MKPGAVQVVDESFTIDSLTQTTTYLLASMSENSGYDVLTFEEGLVTPGVVVRRMADLLSEDASKYMSMLLLDAPELRCRVKEPADWFRGPPASWEAKDTPTNTWLPLSQLSSAQRRWAVISVGLGLGVVASELDDHGMGAVLIDEPESALHPRAERHVLGGLGHIAEELEVPVITTTHSRDFLGAHGIDRRHVMRGQDGLARLYGISSN